MKQLCYILSFIIITGCSTSDNNNDTNNNSNPILNELYFPPINSDTWETLSLNELGWNTNAEEPLYDLLDATGTKAFIILKDGKIVIERYGNSANASTNLVWNSAAKTLSAFMIGIAQEEGYLDINNPSNMYLGNNWANLTSEQESNITVWNHLTMTTGMDYNVANQHCTDADCLNYLNEPGTFWYYHNACYTLTHNIIEGAVNDEFSAYFNSKLRDRVGMQGSWLPIGYVRLYFSTAKSMARFGLLNLNKGVWNQTAILNDINYFNEMITTSQDLNKAYGYLWWLNGKDSYRAPVLTLEFPGKLIENAPDDLFAALGKDDQKLYVVPSQNLVVVRMGDDAGEALLGPSSFDNALWEKINALIN